MNQPLVSPQWLNENLNRSDLILLDASDLENKAGLIPQFKNLKIKGARFFDLKNTFSDPNGRFPNTFPSEEQFEKGCRALGINNRSQIVVYDNIGIYTSPRVWWMFKVMGHENVHVLDGGLPNWVNQGFETVDHFESKPSLGDFKSKMRLGQIKDINFIQSNITNQDYIIIDARSEGRFNGTSDEPRAGLRSGHIPNSINIPYTSLLENGKYKSSAEIKALFEAYKIDDRPLVFSCGSGVTACIVLLASEMVLNNSTAVYDGSWTEWASLM